MFSEHGKPACVFMDQGRQITSTELREFAKCYRFKVLHSTLRHPQSNGFIELVVKVMKQIMSKTDQGRQDAHHAILAYKVIPRGPGKLSLPETMTQCKFRAEYCDHMAWQLPKLQQNQTVWIQLDPGQPAWQKATVTWKSTSKNPRAYHGQTSSVAHYTRKRKFIHQAAEPNSTEPAIPQLSATPLALPMERSVSPPRVPPVHAVTLRTTSPQPWLSAWMPQRLIEDMP